MKKYLLILSVILSLFFFNVKTEAQQLYVNGDAWASPEVTSDYGRREQGSKFHDGVDFANSNNNPTPGNLDIIAINSGNIQDIYLTGYKVIVIRGNDGVDYGYGHIFNDADPTETNHVSLRNFDAAWIDELNDYVIVFNPTQNNTYILTDQPDAIINNASFTYRGKDYSVADGNLLNDVVGGVTRIAPLGDSGGDFGPHIHLYSFVDPVMASPWSDNTNTKDPLLHLDGINETNEPDYDVTLEVKNDGAYFINPSFRVRVDWSDGAGALPNNSRYENVTNTLNEVSIKITNALSNPGFSVIKGAFFNSRISEGSAEYGTGAKPYPHIDSPPGNNDFNIYDAKTGGNSAGFGNYMKNGIVGGSYYDETNFPSWVTNNYNPNPSPGAWDDYFFNDFPTRIRDDDNYGRDGSDVLAEEISLARYPDGEYFIKAEVKDIYGDASSSLLTSLVIDNFKPYVKEVNILTNDASGAMIYRGYYDHNGFNDPITTLTYSSNVNAPTINDDLFVKVEFSEPMTTNTVKAKLASAGGDYVLSSGHSTDQKTFYLPFLRYRQMKLPLSKHCRSMEEI